MIEINLLPHREAKRAADLRESIALLILGLLVIAGFAVVFGVIPGSDLVWLPFIVGVQMVLLLAVALPLAFVCVFVRDIETLTGHLLRIWFFASPVIWTEDRVRETMPWILDANPMAYVLRAYRDVLLENRTPDLAMLAGIGLASSLVVAVVLRHYSHAEHRIIKAI